MGGRVIKDDCEIIDFISGIICILILALSIAMPLIVERFSAETTNPEKESLLIDEKSRIDEYPKMVNTAKSLKSDGRELTTNDRKHKDDRK
ncbi:MAG: hypothetical protein ABIH66_14250 [bacterium]